MTKNTLKTTFFMIFFLSSLLFLAGTQKMDSILLIQKMVKAYDPSGIAQKATSLYTNGDMLMPSQGIKLKVESYFLEPNKFMVKTTSPDGNYDLIFYDGVDVWHKKFDSALAKKAEGMEKLSFIFGSYLESPNMKSWFKHFSTITLEDTPDQIKNNPCYILKCTPEKGFEKLLPIVFYVNKSSFLIEKTITSSFFGDKNIREDVYSIKYKNIDGVNVATETKTDIFGAEINYYISDYKINPTINNKFFKSSTYTTDL